MWFNGYNQMAPAAAAWHLEKEVDDDNLYLPIYIVYVQYYRLLLECNQYKTDYISFHMGVGLNFDWKYQWVINIYGL